jgi:hypothetical protein
MQSRDADPLGLVAEAQRRRALYGRFAYRAPALPPTPEQEAARAKAAIRKQIDKRREELIAAHIEAEAKREAEAELARAREVQEGLPSLAEILELAAEVTGVPVLALKGKRRAAEIAQARHFAMWLMREGRRDLSYPRIARAIGGRDHTTVMHGLRQVEARRGHPPFATWLDDARIRAALIDWADAR